MKSLKELLVPALLKTHRTCKVKHTDSTTCNFPTCICTILPLNAHMHTCTHGHLLPYKTKIHTPTVSAAGLNVAVKRPRPSTACTNACLLEKPQDQIDASSILQRPPGSVLVVSGPITPAPSSVFQLVVKIVLPVIVSFSSENVRANARERAQKEVPSRNLRSRSLALVGGVCILIDNVNPEVEHKVRCVIKLALSTWTRLRSVCCRLTL